MKKLVLAAVAALVLSSPSLAALHEIVVPESAVSTVVYAGQEQCAVSIAVPEAAEPEAILSCQLELRLIADSGYNSATVVQVAAYRDGAVVIPEGKSGPAATYAFSNGEALVQVDIAPILRQSLRDGLAAETLLVGRIDPDAQGTAIVLLLNAGEGAWGRLILHLREF